MRSFLIFLLAILLFPTLAFAGPNPASSDIYRKPTVQILSQLYWALGRLDVKDDQAIDQYILINECDDYSKAAHSKKELARLRKRIRGMLAEKGKIFATHLELVMPLRFGRYDRQTQKFDIEPASQLNHVRKLDIAPNHEDPICGAKQDFKKYPRNIILDLDQPFTLKSIPVSPEAADQLIKSTEQDRPGMNDLVYRDRRLVLLRLKIEVLQYKDTVEFRGHWRGVVSGNVGGYEVYGDYGRRNLLYSSTIARQ